MKALKITPLLFLFCFCNLTSQAQDCAFSTATTSLTTGDVTVYLPNNGHLWNKRDSDAGYTTAEVDNPAGDVGLFFIGGLWMAGLDPGGNLKVAAASYGIINGTGEEDYVPGPLTQEGQIEPGNCANFDRHWQVKKTSIEALLADLADGTLDDAVPFDLLGWPAKGNPHFEAIYGFELPDTPQGLAPFIDRNGDGIYNPEEGDTPNIKGAEQAIWWVFNDRVIHEVSQGDLLLMEVQAMAYSYDSPDPDLNSTTFYDYTFINRSVENLDSFYTTLWIDPDLGCYTDDFIGSDPANNLAFVYNEDEFDGGVECGDCLGGVPDFCGDIPVVGIKVLKGTSRVENGQLIDNGMSSFNYYAGSFANPNPGMHPPQTPIEFYNYMTGRWRNGAEMTVGGTGYDPLGTTPTNYAFSSTPDDPMGWSMCTENLTPEDRRIMISSGPSNLQPGAVTQLSFAVFKSYSNSYPCPSLDNLRDVCEKVDDLFNTATPTATKDLAILPASAVRFAPNPMQDYGVIGLVEGEQLLEEVSIYSLDGSLQKIATGIQAREWKVEREGLNAGMYLYRLQTTEGKWFSGKMIVQ